MENYWIKKSRERDRFRSRQYMSEPCKTNHVRVDLVWDDLYEEEMPILYRNYVDMEQNLHIYLTEMEHAQGIYERSGRVILKG